MSKDILAGYPTQIRKLRKRIKQLNMDDADPQDIKSTIDSLKELETLYQDETTRREERRKAREEKSKLEKESVDEPLPLTPEMEDDAIPTDEPIVEAPAEELTDKPKSTESVPDSYFIKHLVEGLTASDMPSMQALGYDCLKEVIAALDDEARHAVYEKWENYFNNDPEFKEVEAGNMTPRLQEQHDEMQQYVIKKEETPAPEAPIEDLPVDNPLPEEPVVEKESAVSKYALDDQVEPTRGSLGSRGRVMRYDEDSDMAYVHWDEGKLAERDGFGCYKGSDLRNLTRHAESPPGWETTVEDMKKEKGIDNPFALAWWMKNKGYDPEKKSFLTYQAKMKRQASISSDKRFKKADEVEETDVRDSKEFSVAMAQLAQATGLEYDGGSDSRLFLEDNIRVYAPTMGPELYAKMEDEMHQYSDRGAGFEVYVWNDSSGFDYWNKEDESNYIQVTVDVSPEALMNGEINPEEVLDKVHAAHATFEKYDNIEDMLDAREGGNVLDPESKQSELTHSDTCEHCKNKGMCSMCKKNKELGDYRKDASEKKADDYFPGEKEQRDDREKRFQEKKRKYHVDEPQQQDNDVDKEAAGNQAVVDAWLTQSNPKIKSSNLYILPKEDGWELVNYRTVIAKHLGDKIAYSNQRYSSSTSKIQSYIRQAVDAAGIPLVDMNTGEPIDQGMDRPDREDADFHKMDPGSPYERLSALDIKADGEGIGYGGNRPGVAVAPKRDDQVSLQAQDDVELNVANLKWIAKKSQTRDGLGWAFFNTQPVIYKGEEVPAGTQVLVVMDTSERGLSKPELEQALFDNFGKDLARVSLKVDLAILKKGSEVKPLAYDARRRELKFIAVENNKISGWTSIDKFDFQFKKASIKKSTLTIKKAAVKVEFQTPETSNVDYLEELKQFLNSRFKSQEQMETQLDSLSVEFAEKFNLWFDKEDDTLIFKDKSMFSKPKQEERLLSQLEGSKVEEKTIKIKSIKLLEDLAEKCPDCFEKFVKFAEQKGMKVKADDLDDVITNIREKIKNTKERLETTVEPIETEASGEQGFQKGERVTHPNKGDGTITYVSHDQISVQWDNPVQQMLGPEPLPNTKIKDITKIESTEKVAQDPNSPPTDDPGVGYKWFWNEKTMAWEKMQESAGGAGASPSSGFAGGTTY